MKIAANTIHGVQALELPPGTFELVFEVDGQRFAVPIGDEMIVRARDARLVVAPVASNSISLHVVPFNFPAPATAGGEATEDER